MDIRLNGVYHTSIIQHLKDFGLSHFSFDLRPKSFNFTQSYKIKEMLQATASPLVHYYLHFADEKDFVIREIYKSLYEERNDSSLMFEFSGTENLDYFESFKVPYVWHYRESITLEQIRQTQYLKMISFDSVFIERLFQFGKLYQLFGEFAEISHEKKMSLEISQDWNTSVLETLIDFYPIKTLNFEINRQVEKSFRQIDLQQVAGHIEHTKRSLNL